MLTNLATSGVFNRFILSTELTKRSASVGRAVEELDSDYLLSSSTEDLTAVIVAEFDIHPPDLQWEFAEQLPVEETKTDVSRDYRYRVFNSSQPAMAPASRVTVAVPVSGDVMWLGGRASTFLNGWTVATSVVESELHVSRVWINPESKDISAWWQREKEAITRQVTFIQNDLKRWRANLPAQVVRHIEARRARLLRDRGLEGSLGLKVRVRGAHPRPVPVKRKKVATTRARKQTSIEPFQPEPELEEQTYREILDIIYSFGLGLERSPRVAQKYDEEELRDQILMHLNGHFEGEAGGELFNGSGKTDILIRHEKNNVFIGECKFWKGVKAFTGAVDQLASYMVWRDTKAAIILFIKQSNPTVIIDKARAAVRSHSRYKRDGNSSSDPATYTTCVLQHSDDDQREIQLALLPIVIRSKANS